MGNIVSVWNARINSQGITKMKNKKNVDGNDMPPINLEKKARKIR